MDVYMYIYLCVFYVSVCQAKIELALLKIGTAKMYNAGTAGVSIWLKWLFYVNKGKDGATEHQSPSCWDK